MVRNSGNGGKKHKRSAAKNHNSGVQELIFKEDGQEYAQVQDPLGNCRFSLQCQDGKSRMGTVRGKLHKKIWIARGDVVLVGLRDFQDDKCDIIHKYNNDEAIDLRKYEEITFQAEMDEDQEDNGFSFGLSEEQDQNIEEDIDIDNI